MDLKEWREHIERRSDFATRVTHLTKANESKTAFHNLIKILDEKKIYGSGKDGYIIGDKRAVCFQDVPVQSLAENIKYEREINGGASARYEAYGIRFRKNDIFKKGARPVVYGPTKDLKAMLPKNEYWRIVNMDMLDDNSIIDWSHEREWRYPGDLEFKYTDIEVIVWSDKDYREFVDYYRKKNQELLSRIHGIIVLSSSIN